MPHTIENTLEQSPGNYYFEKVMKRIKNVSKCRIEGELIPKVHKIQIKYDEKISQEGYKIISDENAVDIFESTYTGYVYALETLSQMIENANSVKLGKV